MVPMYICHVPHIRHIAAISLDVRLRLNYKYQLWRSGEMVDTADSKSADRKVMPVRVRPPLPDIPFDSILFY